MIFRRTTRKEDNLFNIVRNLRLDIREKVKAEILSEYDEARREGKYPWEGMWLKPEIIGLVQDNLKKKNKVVLTELSVFFFILAFFILPFFSGIAISFFPNQNARKLIHNVGRASPDVKASVKTDAISDVPDHTVKDLAADRNAAGKTLHKERSERFIANQQAKVDRRGVRLRKGPGTQYTSMHMLHYGEILTIKDTGGGGRWVRVSTSRFPDGWVLGDYIKIIYTGQASPDMKAAVKTDTISSVPDHEVKDRAAARDTGEKTLREKRPDRFTENQQAKVYKRGVRLRKGPGTQYTSMHMLHYGEILTIKDTGEGGRWVRISTPRFPDGWVLSDYIKIIK